MYSQLVWDNIRRMNYNFFFLRISLKVDCLAWDRRRWTTIWAKCTCVWPKALPTPATKRIIGRRRNWPPNLSDLWKRSRLKLLKPATNTTFCDRKRSNRISRFGGWRKTLNTVSGDGTLLRLVSRVLMAFVPDRSYGRLTTTGRGK